MTRLTKAAALTHWRQLAPNAPLTPKPIAYKQTGSTYGADGIRIEGTRDFIDAVLGRLQELQQFENSRTRLAVNYQQVEPREGKSNTFAGNWVCYLKVYERGDEARILHARYGGSNHG